MPWKIVPHTADLAVEVEARTPADLYAEAVRAFTDCVTDIVAVAPRERRKLVVRAGDSELLLVELLQEVLSLFEVERLLFVRAVTVLRRGVDFVELEATVFGERYDVQRHLAKVAIKAVTYHELRIWEGPAGWHATVVFDI